MVVDSTESTSKYPKSLVLLLSEQQELVQKVLENEGEVAEDLEKAIKNNETALSAKVDAYEGLLKELDFRAEYLRGEAKDLLEGARVLESKAEFLRDRLCTFIAAIGKPLQGNKRIFKLGKPSVSIELKEGIVLDELPSEFVRTKHELNKIAVRDRWESLSLSIQEYFTKKEKARLIEAVRIPGRNS